MPTDQSVVTYAADLQRRIDRTVGYLRHLLAGPLDARTAMVAEAVIKGLVTPTASRAALHDILAAARTILEEHAADA